MLHLQSVRRNEIAAREQNLGDLNRHYGAMETQLQAKLVAVAQEAEKLANMDQQLVSGG